MLTENDVLDFAEQTAKSYCSRVKNWDGYDDAVSEICVFLFENRGYWDKPRTWLKKRVLGQLIRNFQNRHGLRRKSPPSYAEVDVEQLAERPKREAETRTTKAESRIKIIERALRQPDLAEYAGVIADIIELKPKSEIAKKHGITRGRVSQIFKRFKTVCRRLEAGESEAEITPSAEESDRYPLLYKKQ